MPSCTVATKRVLSITFILSFLSLALIAQIKIKENVKIGDTQRNEKINISADVNAASSSNDYYIIPQDGVFKIIYLLDIWNDPVQANTYIKVTVGGKDYFYSCFNLTDTNPHNECTEYRYESADTNFITVHKNDTLRIIIHSIEDYSPVIYGDESGIYADGGNNSSRCSCGNGSTYGCYTSPGRFSIGGWYLPMIMLGQSKYLQACWSEEYQVLYWLADWEYWSDSPSHSGDPVLNGVEFTVDTIQGKKPGIYWDQYDESGNPLPTDMLRIVGRYWQKDTTYIVYVKAKYNGYDTGNDYDPIAIVPPDSLGSSHNVVKDVFKEDLYLDSLIIKYAGENGIPPQMIKGMMEQECMNPHTEVFEPVWRYEPMEDLKFQENSDLKKRFFPNTSPFVKSTTHPKGTGDWPYSVNPAHSNVYPKEYNDSAITIGSFFSDNWSNYRKVGAKGKPDTLFPLDLRQRFYELYKAPTKLNKVEDDQAKQTAYNELNNELKDAETNLAKRYNVIAQTRIVTSYGLVQFMYSTAIDDDGKYNQETDGRYGQTGTKYMDKSDSHQYPEKLNEQKIFMSIYSDKLLTNLKKLFRGYERIPLSNWSTQTNRFGAKNGYEANWKASLNYYNSDSKYPNLVVTKAKKYIPK
jgi:hypothetical protein